jgi:molecular chaperone DnaJ
MYLYLQ